MDRLDGKGNAKEKWDIISQATEWKRFGVIFILGGIENVNNKNLENQKNLKFFVRIINLKSLLQLSRPSLGDYYLLNLGKNFKNS